MRKNFKSIMKVIFAHEGGYVDHPSDPGGATNLGITIGTLSSWRGRKVTKEEVRKLTRTEAWGIYEKNYWTPVRGNELPSGYDMVAMDAAVNSGVSRGVKWMQRGVGVKADGKVGPATLIAVRNGGVIGIKNACLHRMGFLQGLTNWKVFGKGWGRRVAETEAKAVTLFTNDKYTNKTHQREYIRALAHMAGKQEEKDRKNGTVSAAGGGAAGVGSVLTDSTISTSFVIPAAIVFIVLILFIMRKRANYQKELQRAYKAEVERMET